MFVSHPDTECIIRQMDHRSRLAEGARARRADEAHRAGTGSPSRASRASMIQWHLGTAMVAVGRRLQGVRSGGLAGPTVAGGDVTS